MWNRLCTSVSVALLLGASTAPAGELSNVTLGRFQDFTVVTLFGNAPMSVTHQIVEAKDGKPHRIVVDVMGALHKLPQNNYASLPEGSITMIRTSQFAVSPESVVRVVLDLAHPAAYRLETPENQVRVMVSLPGDPPLAQVWSARGGDAVGAPYESAATLSAAEPQAGSEAGSPTPSQLEGDPAAQAGALPNVDANVVEPESTVSEGIDATPQPGQTPVQPQLDQSAPAWDNPAKSNQPEELERSLPPSPEGALAMTAAQADRSEENAASNQTSESAPSSPAGTPATGEGATAAEGSALPQPAVAITATRQTSESTEAAAGAATEAATEPATEPAAAPDESGATSSRAAPAPSSLPNEPAQTAAEQSFSTDEQDDAPQVPMPGRSSEQPEQLIDYNLPIPAALLGVTAPATDAEGEAAPPDEAAAAGVGEGSRGASGSEPSSQPRLARTSSDAAQAGVPPTAADGLSSPTGSESAATDVGSEPFASLSTLPPLSESAADLIPQRTQVIYHTQGRRDPFKALLQSGGYNAAALPDVANLRLVGVLHDLRESWGLFEDANGYGYILRKGDRVKNGSLSQLTNNRAYFNLTEFGWSRSVHLDLEPEG